jgi:hypothetical protein
MRVFAALLALLLLLAGCPSWNEERLWSTDSGRRSVEVVRLRQNAAAHQRIYHQLRVSDKPPVDFDPFSETSKPERREVPFVAVGEPAPLERRNIVYLLVAYQTDTAAARLERKGAVLPKPTELNDYATRDGKTWGQSFRCQDPSATQATPKP